MKYSAKVRSGNKVTIAAPMQREGKIMASCPSLFGDLVIHQDTSSKISSTDLNHHSWFKADENLAKYWKPESQRHLSMYGVL